MSELDGILSSIRETYRRLSPERKRAFAKQLLLLSAPLESMNDEQLDRVQSLLHREWKRRWHSSHSETTPGWCQR